MLDALLRTALPGTAVTLAWLAADRLFGKRLPAVWHYRILKLALALFLIPVWPLAAWAASLTPVPAPAAPAVSTPGPALPVIQIPDPPILAEAVPVPAAPAAVSVPVDALQILTIAWAAAAAAALCYRLWAYGRFRREVLRQSRPVSDGEALALLEACKTRLGLRRSVALLENPAVETPLSTGLLRPAIVLPAGGTVRREELRYVFLHELTHIKRGDLWVRLLAMLAAAVHWYDPLAYILKRGIRRVSEQSCDELVAGPLSGGQRFAYGSMLLRLAAEGGAYPQEWAAPLSARDTVERRLYSVLHPEKLKGRRRLLALGLSLVIAVCGATAAFAAQTPLVEGEALPPAGGQNLPQVVNVPNAPLTEEDSSLPDAGTLALSWPVQGDNRTVSSGFGYRWNPGGESRTLHDCMDIAAPEGEVVLAAADGTVSETGYDPVRGNYLILDHGGGVSTVYAACRNLEVKTGDTVQRGGMLAAVGSTGQSTGSHLCFRVLKDGAAQDPMDWFDEAARAAVRTPAEPEAAPPAVAGGQPDSLPAQPKDGDAPQSGDAPEPRTYTLPSGTTVTLGAGSEPAQPADRPEKKTYTVGDVTITFGVDGEPNPHPTQPVSDETVGGDADLIQKRGGTLLPDSEYVLVNGVKYKMFAPKKDTFGEYVFRLYEYEVGNKNAVRGDYVKWLDTLVDGEYPKNAQGQTYGIYELANYVGYLPDLTAHPADFLRDGEAACVPLEEYIGAKGSEGVKYPQEDAQEVRLLPLRLAGLTREESLQVSPEFLTKLANGEI